MFLVRILALVARAFVAVCLDSCWASLQVSVGGGAHCVGPGSSCLDVFFPVEILSQLNSQVLSAQGVDCARCSWW